ncbi:hypothetical protein ACVWZM_005748 [Bradyrhizobium sp. USDA 4501]
MVAQDMRDIGVGLTETDDDLEQCANRQAGAAGFDRKPQRAEAGLANEIDLRERQDALAFAVGGAFRDAAEQRVDIGCAAVKAVGRLQRGGGQRLVHWYHPNGVD